MAMTSLKMDDSRDDYEYKRNQYGYGLELSLYPEQCAKLGIDKQPHAGQAVTVKAIGVVSSADESLDATADGGSNVSLRIQITDIELKMDGPANAIKAAEMLYGTN
ncbi:conserved hypothetical protein [Gammaproteobacteria bacterium]